LEDTGVVPPPAGALGRLALGGLALAGDSDGGVPDVPGGEVFPPVLVTLTLGVVTLTLGVVTLTPGVVTLTPGTDTLTLGTDKLTFGTDKPTLGTDKLTFGTDALTLGTVTSTPDPPVSGKRSRDESAWAIASPPASAPAPTPSSDTAKTIPVRLHRQHHQLAILTHPIP
jgi:hypothetical protein